LFWLALTNELPPTHPNATTINRNSESKDKQPFIQSNRATRSSSTAQQSAQLGHVHRLLTNFILANDSQKHILEPSRCMKQRAAG